MIVGTAAQRPVILALGLLDRQIINACNSQAHQPVLIEFPVLVAIAPEPMATVIVPFVRETNRNPVLPERPNLLDQAVVEFAIPLARQKRFDFRSALDEQFEHWLNGNTGVEELKPAPNDYLQRWAVSKRVNSSKADKDDATLIEPIKAAV
jgi:hypothetical protein